MEAAISKISAGGSKGGGGKCGGQQKQQALAWGTEDCVLGCLCLLAVCELEQVISPPEVLVLLHVKKELELDDRQAPLVMMQKLRTPPTFWG